MIVHTSYKNISGSRTAPMNDGRTYDHTKVKREDFSSVRARMSKERMSLEAYRREREAARYR